MQRKEHVRHAAGRRPGPPGSKYAIAGVVLAAKPPASRPGPPDSPAYRVERQVDVSPQPPVVHQPLPAVTDPGEKDPPLERPRPRGPDPPPASPSPSRGGAAPRHADPVPNREVREDLQQDRVWQLGKRRHNSADTYGYFRLKGFEISLRGRWPRSPETCSFPPAGTGVSSRPRLARPHLAEKRARSPDFTRKA